MKRRLNRAYDHMTMPESCVHRIEEQLQQGLHPKKKGYYTKRVQPMKKRKNIWAGAAAACLMLVVLASGGQALLGRMEQPSPGPAAVQTKISGAYEYREQEDGTLCLTRYLGSEEIVTVPGSLDGKPVTGLGTGETEQGVFQEHPSVRRVILPEGLKEIGPEAFRLCQLLETVAIPDTVEQVGAQAFSQCPNLTAVIFQGSPPEAGADLFYQSEQVRAYYQQAEGWTDLWQGVPTAPEQERLDLLLGTVTPEDPRIQTALAAFLPILEGDGKFYHVEYAEEFTLDEFCDAYTRKMDFGMKARVSLFTLADLDRDGVRELVLRLQWDDKVAANRLVLRYQDERVFGYSFEGRHLFGLNKDGSFECADTADRIGDGVGWLEFEGMAWTRSEFQTDRTEPVPAQWHVYPCTHPDWVLESYQYANEDWGMLPGSQFRYFKKLSNGEKEAMVHSGDGIVHAGDFLFDKDTPGTVLYTIEDDGIGYYLNCEYGEYQAEVRGIDSEKLVYVVDVQKGGKTLASAQAMLDYLTEDLGTASDQARVKALAEEFAIAYFEGDTDTLREYVWKASSIRIEGYSRPGNVSLVQVKNLPASLWPGDVWTVSVELLEPQATDSYSYLTMELILDPENGLKVKSYGLEK